MALAWFCVTTTAASKSKTPATARPWRAFAERIAISLFDFVLRVQTRAARDRRIGHDRATAHVRRVDGVAVEVAERPRLEVRARVGAARRVLVRVVERIVDREVQ